MQFKTWVGFLGVYGKLSTRVFLMTLMRNSEFLDISETEEIIFVIVGNYLVLMQIAINFLR